MSKSTLQTLRDEFGETGPTPEEIYHDAFARFAEADPKDDISTIIEALHEMRTARASLGILGHVLFSINEIDRVLEGIEHGSPDARTKLINTFLSVAQLRHEVFADDGSTWAEPEIALRHADKRFQRLIRSKSRARLWEMYDRIAEPVVDELDQALRGIGWVGSGLGRLLTLPSGRSAPARLSRGAGRLIESFLSYEALRRTGLETSWGFRTYLPGTFGIAGNAGPWAMFYSGRLIDAQTRRSPMRINPGATVSLPFGVGTINRPGLGAGAALGPASAYLDRARYKLLFGIDGVLYVRIGDWIGRGPYFTVSASIPITPVTSITWNASIFSPGFGPLVVWSTPIAILIRRKIGAIRDGFRRIWGRLRGVLRRS